MTVVRTVKEIIAEIDELNARLSALHIELSNANLSKRSHSSDSYKKRKAVLDQAAPIFAKMLKPGDYVKVTGTRASPYREVKEINEHELIGATCTFNNRTGSIAKVNSYEIISCGTNKIIAVLRNGEWVPAKKILEGH